MTTNHILTSVSRLHNKPDDYNSTHTAYSHWHTSALHIAQCNIEHVSLYLILTRILIFSLVLICHHFLMGMKTSKNCIYKINNLEEFVSTV